MKTVLITGARGFIGRNLREALTNTYHVTAPSTAELDLVDSDQVQSYLADHQFDVIIHTATWNATRSSSKDRSLVFQNNTRMFFNIARGHESYGRLIYYGSGAEFDREHWQPRMTEDYFDAHVPSDQYGFSKYVMAKYTALATNIVNLRLFGVFGKYEDWRIRFISNAICRVLHGQPIAINQNMRLDYLYIDDLIAITRWFMENPVSGHTCNVCTGTSVDLATIAEWILSITRSDQDIHIHRTGLGRECSGSNLRLLETIGDYSFVDPHLAIASLCRWYQQEIHHLSGNDLSRYC